VGWLTAYVFFVALILIESPDIAVTKVIGKDKNDVRWWFGPGLGIDDIPAYGQQK
jgi:hypothetical protein